MQSLMIQGTTSDAGKSVLVTALCRYFYRQGVKIAPFKPQNMALNSAVTLEGYEIGRAQAVQAIAAGLPPEVDMNPILLKPNSDKTAQVIIHGVALANQDAKTYHAYKKSAMKAVLDSYQRLTEKYHCIIIEGAGSPAEINLREHDIANMGFAEKVNCPVILIADIDKGGVFAHLVGTLALLSTSERQRIIGFVINRFRGDLSLLTPGIKWLEQETAKPVLAVLPYLDNFHLESEDSTTLKGSTNQDNTAFNIVVPRLPRMSNHTDFDPLLVHPEIQLNFIKDSANVDKADLIILPGSKSVRVDLQWLKNHGWETLINRHLRYQGKLIGICGGYQMLGNAIHDPQGVEGLAGTSLGLGLLDIETTLTADKVLQQDTGHLILNKALISGYQIHAGITTGGSLNKPLMQLSTQYEGAISEDNLIIGTYLHGLFDQPTAANSLLKWAGKNNFNALDYAIVREDNINLITDTLTEHFDFSLLDERLKKFNQIR
jgi:adenosylcobyric acid synthase